MKQMLNMCQMKGKSVNVFKQKAIPNEIQYKFPQHIK